MTDLSSLVSIATQEYFGSGLNDYYCVIVTNDGHYKKIVIYADNYAEVIAKVNLRFGLVVKQEFLTEEVLKLYFKDDNHCYIYKHLRE